VERVPTTSGWVFRFERGLSPRNLFRGEVRKGGGAPLRVEEGIAAMAVVAVEINSDC
jgi:hypothetical protein